MRLLSPKEITKKREAESQDEFAIRTKIAANIKALKSLEESQSAERTRLQTEFGISAIRMSGQKTALATEVETLETRKNLALIPLDRIRKDLEDLQSYLDERQDELKAGQLAMQEREQKLTDQADFIAGKSVELAKRETEVRKSEKANQANTSAVKKARIELAGQQDEFVAYRTKAEEVLSTQQAAVRAEQKSIETIKESLDVQAEDLRQYKRQLLDERLVLDKAWNELHSKQHGTGKKR